MPPSVRAWVALDRVVEVPRLEQVTQEEHGRVVANEVPGAFLRVELDREAANIALGILRPSSASSARAFPTPCGAVASTRVRTCGEELTSWPMGIVMRNARARRIPQMLGWALGRTRHHSEARMSSAAIARQRVCFRITW